MIWTTLLIWVAKQLISYFLKTNADLSRQLDESVQRYEDHKKGLENLEDKLTELLQDQKDAQEDIDWADTAIKQLESDWEQKLLKIEEVKRRNVEIIDATSDDDIIRTPLPFSG